MIIDKTSWQNYFQGYSLLDATFSKPTRFWLALIENYGSHDPRKFPKTRILSINTELPMESRFSVSEYAHFDKISLAFQSAPFRDVLGVDLRCSVYSFNSQFNGEEPAIDTRWLENKRAPTVNRLKQVNGRVYAVAGDRMLFMRKDVDQWQLDDGLPRPQRRLDGSGSVLQFGFNDVAAFPDGEMYAVGGKAEVWHNIDGAWQQVPFPEPIRLDSVCCAGNGLVYVYGQGGSLWVGKNGDWQHILTMEWINLGRNDLIWFDAKLWLGNEYGLWYLDGTTLQLASQLLPTTIAPCFGHLDLSADSTQLLTHNAHAAAFYDGLQWQILFDTRLYA